MANDDANVHERPTGISDSMAKQPAVISDNGRVRIGDLSPGFPPVRGRPADTADSRKVRIGDLSPGFPPLRSR
jgi:hypothetical protein